MHNKVIEVRTALLTSIDEFYDTVDATREHADPQAAKDHQLAVVAAMDNAIAIGKSGDEDAKAKARDAMNAAMDDTTHGAQAMKHEQALETAQNFTRTLYMDLKHKTQINRSDLIGYDIVSPAGVHSDAEVYALFFKQQ